VDDKDAVSASDEAVRGGVVRQALDKALGVQVSAVERNVARARQRRPDATPAEVVRTLERMYRTALTGSGAAVGAAAAVPTVGTGAALVLSGGESLTSLELSVLFTLSLAEIHGVRVDELERRRTLVLGVLLGGGSTETIKKVAGRTGPHWAKQIVGAVPLTTLRQINRVLGRNFVTRYGTRQGIVVLGRIVPFGVGAAIGAGANLALAETTIRAARRAFGPAPLAWDVPDQSAAI